MPQKSLRDFCGIWFYFVLHGHAWFATSAMQLIV